MRTILGGALAAVLLAGVGVGVVGVTPASATDQQPLTWSVQPATAKGLDKRPNFTTAVGAGKRVVDHVAVSNYSTKPLTLNLYATDAFNTDQGEFSLLPSATKPKDVGTWIELKKNKLTVPARSKTIVPFAIDVPANASPGDHTGGIVASLTTGANTSNAGKVAIEQRAGTRLYLRVIGEAAATLDVTDVRVSYEGSANPVAAGTAVVTYTVRNPGNTRMSGRRTVEVAGPFGAGRASAEPTALPELLPGEHATYTERVTGVRPLGRMTATVDIAPVPLPVSEASETMKRATGSVTFWAVSWTLFAVVLLLLAAVAGTLLVRRARRTAGPVAASAADASAPPTPVA